MHERIAPNSPWSNTIFYMARFRTQAWAVQPGSMLKTREPIYSRGASGTRVYLRRFG